MKSNIFWFLTLTTLLMTGLPNQLWAAQKIKPGLYANTENKAQQIRINNDLTLEFNWSLQRTDNPSADEILNFKDFSAFGSQGRRKWSADGLVEKTKYRATGVCAYPAKMVLLPTNKNRFRMDLAFPLTTGNDWGSWGSSCTAARTLNSHLLMKFKRIGAAPNHSLSHFRIKSVSYSSKSIITDSILGNFVTIDDEDVEIQISKSNDQNWQITGMTRPLFSIVGADTARVINFDFNFTKDLIFAESHKGFTTDGKVEVSPCGSTKFAANIIFYRISKSRYVAALRSPNNLCNGSTFSTNHIMFRDSSVLDDW